MTSMWPVCLLILVLVVSAFAISENDDSIDMRFRRMERDFSLTIQSLKFELKVTQDKLGTVQAGLDSTKATVQTLSAELLATQTDLKETRIELQETREKLFAKELGLDVKSYNLTDADEKNIQNPDKARTGKIAPYQIASPSEHKTLAAEPKSTWRRLTKSSRIATRGRRVTDNNVIAKRAFSAQTDHHENALVTHQTVLFPHVILNEGSTYDNLTGVFTCPESGIYHFSVTIMVFRSEEVETELVVNGNAVMYNYAGGNQQHNQGTNSVLVRLDVGDRAWVRILQNTVVNKDGAMRIHGYGWSTFTGFMI